MRRTLLLVLVACGLQVALSQRSTSNDVAAGTAVRQDVAELLEHSGLVFEGRVREARTFESAPGRIETEYTVDVERTFWGADSVQQSFRFPGGVLADGRGLVIPGMPDLRVGEQALLFLSETGGGGLRMPVGLSQGKFNVVTSLSGVRSLTRLQGQLSVVDPVTGVVQHTGAGELFDYAQTVAELRAAAERRAAGGGGRGAQR